MIETHQCFQFTNIQFTEPTLTATWIVPHDLPYLQGHFPEQPIVPAVAMLDATLELLNAAFSRTHVLSQVKNAKFVKPLEPSQTVSIECKRMNESEWNADWRVENETVAKIYFAI